MNKKQKTMLIRIIIASITFVLLQFVESSGVLRFVLFMIPYLILGYDILLKAVSNIINGRVFDECFLMATATVGAVALAIYSKSGDYNEAVAVMLFYQIGELFQSYAVSKSRKNITELMDIRPDYANIEQDGKIIKVDPEEVEIGSVIVIQPGEKVPLDGIVLAGSSSLDTSALTGESRTRDVNVGDEIISGSINLSGVLRVRVEKEFFDSTVSKILDLVENASSRKSKSEDFITKFARVYTPAVCLSALALAILPPIFNMVSGSNPSWAMWIYRALTFLVISCPCALVISIPLTFFAGLGGASKAGVLVKGSNYLETLSKAEIVVFDKTGTLTKGGFDVVGVRSNKISEEKLIEEAAYAESSSSHPISKSIVKRYGKEIDLNRIASIEEIAGEGVVANIDGNDVACGNSKLMKRLNIAFEEGDVNETVIHVAVNGEYSGSILLSDVLKESSKSALKELKRAGIKKTIMLTGDRREVAEKVAKELEIDDYSSDLLPQDKVRKIEELLSIKEKGEALCFVGDGINDAPVLSRADVGIAMGALGSDAAIEAADVVLMDDDPLKVSKAIRIARKCIRIVYENIVFAIGVKLICLVLGAFGIANMPLAIFADVGVMVIAVLNAVRALFVKNV